MNRWLSALLFTPVSAMAHGEHPPVISTDSLLHTISSSGHLLEVLLVTLTIAAIAVTRTIINKFKRNRLTAEV